MNTEIIFICDRSGSMAAVKSDMEPAMNKFLDEQKALGEEAAKLKMIMFDTAYDIAYDGLLKDAPPFKLQPRGCTALLDAIGKTLGNIPETGPEARTLAIILTDGLENSSREWTRQRVLELIQKLSASANFSVTYLGANQDAIQEAGAIGIPMAAAMTFANTAQGVSNTVDSVSNQSRLFRSGAASAVCYSTEDRTRAMDKD